MILKTVNMQEVSVAAEIVLEGLADKRLSIEVYEMSGHQPEDENSFERPMLVSPKQKALQTEGSSFAYEFPKQSVAVMRLR
ncbi:alpha-L-arabinofuranosidase C-terminal domain-containing protein [Paenibacillus sp. FSL L8-0436]|uniref:alpha-L-arabinofuranosidase C-terminal domain-containing protein n=1 Tax=Paenibacillus sp. FSL L8-0436 TaxID=2954686 RepID=UPI0031588A8E